jgi:hypothetical protein
MNLDAWTLTFGDLTKSLADWGIDKPVVDLESWGCDTFTFKASGRNIDAGPILPYKAWIVITDPTGTTRFAGPVTKMPVKGSSKAEDQFYTVSGPWWYFQRLVYQMTWNIQDPDVVGKLIPTLRSLIIVGLNPNDGTKIDLGQMSTAIFNYVLSVAAASNPAFVPFQLGVMTPDTIIPFSEVDSVTCAQLMVTFFAWVQDAGLWFDYSTKGLDGKCCPTINVGQRYNFKPVALKMGAKPLSSVDLNPRYDLVVNAVVIKYATSNTDDGATTSQILVDEYPPGAQDPGFDVVVQNIELQPGNTTYQKQTLKTTDRPVDYNASNGTGRIGESALNGGGSTIALAWLSGEHRFKNLRQYTIPAGADPNSIDGGCLGNTTPADIVVNVDQENMQVISVVTTYANNATTIDPKTGETIPAPLKLPTGTVAPGAGPNTAGEGKNALDYLTQELLEGTVPPWLTSFQNIYSARVLISITVKYTGNDPVVQSWFGQGPEWVRTFLCPAVLTNGSSQTYKQPTSITPPEPVPQGLAQNQYNALSVLHYEGSVVLIEPECTGLVGLGNVVNITNTLRPEWASMNAQVFKVTMDLITGTTTIKLGPPVNLDAKKLTEILRSVRGRIQTWHLDQQQTGQIAAAGNAVDGAGASAMAGLVAPSSSFPSRPWTLTFQQTPEGLQCRVELNSSIDNPKGQVGQVPMTGLGSWFLCTPNVSGGDAVWIEGTVNALSVTAATIHSIGQGNNDFDTTGLTPSYDASGKGDLVANTATPPQQTLFRVLIGTITADSRGNPIVKYSLSQNLALKNRAVVTGSKSIATIYPEPYGH